MNILFLFYVTSFSKKAIIKCFFRGHNNIAVYNSEALNIASKKASLYFSSNTCQEIDMGIKKKSIIDCLIKLNENDWIFEEDVKMQN